MTRAHLSAYLFCGNTSSTRAANGSLSELAKSRIGEVGLVSTWNVYLLKLKYSATSAQTGLRVRVRVSKPLNEHKKNDKGNPRRQNINFIVGFLGSYWEATTLVYFIAGIGVIPFHRLDYMILFPERMLL